MKKGSNNKKNTKVNKVNNSSKATKSPKTQKKERAKNVSSHEKDYLLEDTKIINVKEIQKALEKEPKIETDSIKENNDIKQEINTNDYLDLSLLEEPKSDVKEEKVPVKVNKKLYFSYNFRVVMNLILLLLFLVISLFCLLKIVTLNSASKTAYTESSNINYLIYFKEKDVYGRTFIDKKDIKDGIASNTIKNIDLDFGYNFDIGQQTNLDVIYSVVAKLFIMDSSQKKSFVQEEYELLSNKELHFENNNHYEVSEKVTLDYDHYIQLANNFKSLYGEDCVAKLNVYLKINKKSNTTDEILIDDNSRFSIDIPLDNSGSNILFNTNNLNNKVNVKQTAKFRISSLIYLLGLILAGCMFFKALFELIKLLAVLYPRNSQYDYYINELLDQYENVIEEENVLTSFVHKNVIKVASFEELLLQRDKDNCKIKFYSVVAHQKCYFYLIKDDNVYIYKVKASNLNK